LKYDPELVTFISRMNELATQAQVEELKSENVGYRQDLGFRDRLLEGVRDGLWHRDLKTDKLSLSPHWWQSLGYTEEEMPKTSRELLALIHQDDRRRVEDAVRGHLDGVDREYKCIFLLRSKRGEYHNILSRGIRSPIDSPDPVALSGSHTDLTDLQVRASQNEHLFHIYESILKTIPHLILIKDKKGRFRYVNDALVKFYGAESAEVMTGKTDADYNTNQQQVDTFNRSDQEVISRGITITLPKETNTDLNGVVHYLSTVKAPLKNPDGTTYVVVVGTFIDELVEAQEDLSAAKERERKLSVIQQLAGQMSHKLNTRIATLENRVLLIADENSPKLDATLQALDDVKRFAGNFLELSLANILKYSETNLGKIIHSAINMTDSDASSIVVNGDSWQKLSKTDNTFALRADEAKLLDVFAELISNSIRNSYQKGNNNRQTIIEIQMRPSSLNNTPAFGPPKALDCLRITFEDNGPGVPPELKKKIFEPFFSTRSEGTGLGLTVVRDVIEAHKGRIREIGYHGIGACFEIILPMP